MKKLISLIFIGLCFIGLIGCSDDPMPTITVQDNYLVVNDKNMYDKDAILNVITLDHFDGDSTIYIRFKNKTLSNRIYSGPRENSQIVFNQIRKIITDREKQDVK